MVSFHLQGLNHSEISAAVCWRGKLISILFSISKIPCLPQGAAFTLSCTSFIYSPQSAQPPRWLTECPAGTLPAQWIHVRPWHHCQRLQNPGGALQSSGYVIPTLLHMTIWNKYYREAFLWRETHKNGCDIYSLLNLLFYRRSCRFLLQCARQLPKMLLLKPPVSGAQSAALPPVALNLGEMHKWRKRREILETELPDLKAIFETWSPLSGLSQPRLEKQFLLSEAYHGRIH